MKPSVPVFTNQELDQLCLDITAAMPEIVVQIRKAAIRKKYIERKSTTR